MIKKSDRGALLRVDPSIVLDTKCEDRKHGSSPLHCGQWGYENSWPKPLEKPYEIYKVPSVSLIIITMCKVAALALRLKLQQGQMCKNVRN